MALVTGGAVRMGRAICLALAREGAGVVIHYNHSADEAAELVREIRDAGGRAWKVRAALNSEAGCRRLVHDARRRAGKLDLLVNNAAVFHKNSLRAVSAANLLDEFWPNLFAPLLLTRFFAEGAAAGRIVNLLDRRITGDDISCVPYLLSKKGLAEATRLAALELAPDFTVNAVAPGAVLPPPGKGEKYVRDLAGAAPLARRVTPEDIAAAVVFLLQQDAMTGQVLFVDGGQNLQRGETGAKKKSESRRQESE